MTLDELKNISKKVTKVQAYLEELTSDLTRVFKLQKRIISLAKQKPGKDSRGIDEGWRQEFLLESENWSHGTLPFLESTSAEIGITTTEKIHTDQLVQLSTLIPKGTLGQKIKVLLESDVQIRKLLKPKELPMSLSKDNANQLTNLISRQVRNAKSCARELSREIKRKEREQSQENKRKTGSEKQLEKALTYFEVESKKVVDAENSARQILEPWGFSYSASRKRPTLTMQLQAVNLTQADENSILRYINKEILRGLSAVDLNINISIVKKVKALDGKTTHVVLIGEPKELGEDLFHLSVGRSSVSFVNFVNGSLRSAESIPENIRKIYGLPEGPGAFRFFSADRVSRNVTAEKAIEALVDGSVAHARKAAHARLSNACSYIRQLAARANGTAISKQFELKSAEEKLADQLEVVETFSAAFREIIEEEQKTLMSSLQAALDTAFSPGGQIGRLLEALSSEHTCDAVRVDTKQEGKTGLLSLITGRNRKPYYYLSENSRVDLLRLLIHELRSVANQLSVLELSLVKRTDLRLGQMVNESGGGIFGKSSRTVSLEPAVIPFSMIKIANEIVGEIPKKFSIREQKPASLWGAVKEAKKAPMQLMPVVFIAGLLGYELEEKLENYPYIVIVVVLLTVIAFFVPLAQKEQAKAKLMKDLSSCISKAARDISQKWFASIKSESQIHRSNIFDGLLTPAIENAKAHQESEVKSEIKRLAVLVQSENGRLGQLKSDLSVLENLNKGLLK